MNFIEKASESNDADHERHDEHTGLEVVHRSGALAGSRRTLSWPRGSAAFLPSLRKPRDTAPLPPGRGHPAPLPQPPAEPKLPGALLMPSKPGLLLASASGRRQAAVSGPLAAATICARQGSEIPRHYCWHAIRAGAAPWPRPRCIAASRARRLAVRRLSAPSSGGDCASHRGSRAPRNLPLDCARGARQSAAARATWCHSC